MKSFEVNLWRMPGQRMDVCDHQFAEATVMQVQQELFEQNRQRSMLCDAHHGPHDCNPVVGVVTKSQISKIIRNTTST